MENETKDWERNPHLYLQDDDGNFVSFTADDKSTGEVPLDLGKRCLV